ncbi:hypothetical protein CRE_22359 [Caenorhabditis remanei]|uniref:Uncharacterized protein n=1 Tax=Caenorhabditis remanei TaxID=31234 RepID=E3MEB2_CAERE|nr:hypothetical protein CRE_22359 [Caenorhabditis remanei]
MSTLTTIEEEQEVSVEEISETRDSEIELLLSDEELRDVYGKKRSLETLLTHPRAKTVSLQGYINMLTTYYDAFISYQDLKHTKKEREKLEGSMKRVANLEDLLIRVIVREEKLLTVLAEHKKRMTQ